jgi:hypothetical protein
MHMPHVHGGFFYLRKNSELLKPFLNFAIEAFIKYDKKILT